jgi:hypothetical protein
MRRPDPSDAELPLRIRATRHSRRELERLLARAKRAIEAFATSSDADAAGAETSERTPPRPSRLVGVAALALPQAGSPEPLLP